MIGDAVRQRRTALGMTQEDLSRAAAVPVRIVSALETGQTQDPRASTLVALATALRCKVDDLTAGGVPPTKQAKRRKGK
jgi:transcriptional regulator with XRE-family HTH domain